MKRSTFLAGLASLAVTGIQRTALAADNWPSRPIRVLLPAAAGTGSDILGRALLERVGAALGQPMFVDNKPGGSGLIATRALMAAAPDGYTFLYSNGSASVMLAAMKPDLGIDFTKDVAPVALTVIGGVFLLVNPSFPARNLQELIAQVKANPGKYSYGSWAIGSNGHLTMEWLKKQTGMQIEHVPYKGMPTLLTELASGVIPIGWTDPISSVPFIRSGKVRAIAVNGPTRTPQLPDLPTMGEQGYPFKPLGWQGFFAPAGTPQPIIERMHSEVNKVLANPEVQAIMLRMNTDAPPLWTTDQFRDMLARDLVAWRKIAQDSNIRVD
jgi:tripartite-type tricarboxylate transporter receptor subunit TctC